MRFSIEAEQSVIGALMLNSGAADDVLEIICADDFYREDHRIIFSVIQEFVTSGKPIDVIGLSESLSQQGNLDRIGGLVYLVEIANNTPSAANAKTYAQIIADRSVERSIAEAGQRIFEIGNSTEGDVDEKLNAIHGEFASLERTDRTEMVDFNSLLKAEIGDIDQKFRKMGKPGLMVGFSDLDRRFGGIEETDLWILAARPSMGKTALALNIVQSVAHNGMDVLVFSLEMSREQLTKRLLSSASGVPYSVLRSGDLVEHNWPQLSTGVAKLKDSRIHIVDIPALDVNRALAIARKISRKGKLGLVVVDYLQLMTAKSDSRLEEISYISRQLKVMAKTVKAPVMALSQLSRKCEDRSDKRPVNSDLRESGQIEQDADIISFIYRDEVYHRDTPNPGVAEIITSKFRNGEIGTDYLACQLQFSRFKDLDYSCLVHEQKASNGKRGFDA